MPEVGGGRPPEVGWPSEFERPRIEGNVHIKDRTYLRGIFIFWMGEWTECVRKMSSGLEVLGNRYSGPYSNWP